MAFTHIGSAEYNSGSSALATTNKPTNTQDWDIMFMIISSPSHYSNSLPSWWISLWQNYISWSSTMYIEVLYKIANSEWSSYNIWFPFSSKIRVLITTYRWWFNSLDPIDIVSNTIYTGSDYIIRGASMDVSDINSSLVFIWFQYYTSTTTFTKPSIPTTDWVENYDWWSTAPDLWNIVCSMIWSWSWATWTMDAASSTPTNVKHWFAIALNPYIEPITNSWFFMFM